MSLDDSIRWVVEEKKGLVCGMVYCISSHEVRFSVGKGHTFFLVTAVLGRGEWSSRDELDDALYDEALRQLNLKLAEVGW